MFRKRRTDFRNVSFGQQLGIVVFFGVALGYEKTVANEAFRSTISIYMYRILRSTKNNGTNESEEYVTQSSVSVVPKCFPPTFKTANGASQPLVEK